MAFGLDTFSLKDRLEQHDAGGNGHVQALYGAVHRNRHKAVAPIPDKAAQASTFGAQHDGRRQCEIDRVVRVLCIGGKADGPME